MDSLISAAASPARYSKYTPVGAQSTGEALLWLEFVRIQLHAGLVLELSLTGAKVSLNLAGGRRVRAGTWDHD